MLNSFRPVFGTDQRLEQVSCLVTGRCFNNVSPHLDHPVFEQLHEHRLHWPKSLNRVDLAICLIDHRYLDLHKLLHILVRSFLECLQRFWDFDCRRDNGLLLWIGIVLLSKSLDLWLCLGYGFDARFPSFERCLSLRYQPVKHRLLVVRICFDCFHLKHGLLDLRDFRNLCRRVRVKLLNYLPLIKRSSLLEMRWCPQFFGAALGFIEVRDLQCSVALCWQIFHRSPDWWLYVRPIFGRGILAVSLFRLWQTGSQIWCDHWAATGHFFDENLSKPLLFGNQALQLTSVDVRWSPVVVVVFQRTVRAVVVVFMIAGIWFFALSLDRSDFQNLHVILLADDCLTVYLSLLSWL